MYKWQKEVHQRRNESSTLMHLMKKELLSNDLLHADETTLEVLLEPGRAATAKSYMWL